MLQGAALDRSKSETEVLEQLRNAALKDPLTDVLKTAVDLLKQNFEPYCWVGIYLVKGNDLALAAYAGEGETEHVRIPIGQGICGLAAEEGKSIIVPDVSKDSRYLICFPSTRSEIVVPIKSGNIVLGEIDIDSDRLSAFARNDKRFLEQVASTLAAFLEEHPESTSI